MSGDHAALIKMCSQAEVFFCCKLFFALSFLNLLMGLAFLPSSGAVFRKRNALCFTCQTLILTHPSLAWPSWGRIFSMFWLCTPHTLSLLLRFSPSTTLKVFRAALAFLCFIFFWLPTLLCFPSFSCCNMFLSSSKANQLCASWPAVVYRNAFYFCIAINPLHNEGAAQVRSHFVQKKPKQKRLCMNICNKTRPKSHSASVSVLLWKEFACKKMLILIKALWLL